MFQVYNPFSGVTRYLVYLGVFNEESVLYFLYRTYKCGGINQLIYCAPLEVLKYVLYIVMSAYIESW